MVRFAWCRSGDVACQVIRRWLSENVKRKPVLAQAPCSDPLRQAYEC